LSLLNKYPANKYLFSLNTVFDSNTEVDIEYFPQLGQSNSLSPGLQIELITSS